MPISATYERLRQIVEVEFGDIVVYTEYVSTYPKHFHDGNEQNVVASYLSSHPPDARRVLPNVGAGAQTYRP